MNRLGRIIGTLAAICLLIGGTFWSLNQLTSSSDDQKAQPAYSLDETKLDSQLQELLGANSDLDTSISIIDLQTGERYHYGETSSYTAASITKLLTATLFLHEVEFGRASLQDIIGNGIADSQLEKLIVKSDNEAWHALNDTLTTEALEAYAHKLGLQSYSASQNTITSEDTAQLLNKLARGKLLNNTHTNLLLSLMERADMRNFIIAGIPEGTTAYHKVGYLSDRLHDASLIRKGDRSYILVIFSKSAGSYSFGRGASLFQDITARTSGVFFTPQAATPDTE